MRVLEAIVAVVCTLNFGAAARAQMPRLCIELRDASDSQSLPTSVRSPQLDRAALFLCTARACSYPVFKVLGQVARAELWRAR
jgi:uncharacterized protein